MNYFLEMPITMGMHPNPFEKFGFPRTQIMSRLLRADISVEFLLNSGCPVYTTAEIVLAVLKNVVFERETDPTYGFKGLVVKPETK